MEIQKIHIGAIAIHIAAIDPLPGESRREAERRTIATITGTVLPGAAIGHRADGSPVLQGIDAQISISHSRRYAALAIWPGGPRFGIDIEQWRPTLRRVIPKFLSDDETAEWSADDALLLRAWTLKEALYKAAGIPGVDFARQVCLPASVSDATATVVGQPFDVATLRPRPDACLSIAVPHGSGAL